MVTMVTIKGREGEAPASLKIENSSKEEGNETRVKQAKSEKRR